MLKCVRCSEPYSRDPKRLVQPFLCPDCTAKRDADTLAELQTATIEGDRRSRYRAWQDRLFIEHRNGRHKTFSTPGCEPCSIARAVNEAKCPKCDGWGTVSYASRGNPNVSDNYPCPECTGVPRALR